MNNKIIGFSVLPNKLTKNDIDIFKVGLNLKIINHKIGFIHYWGIGNLDKCFVAKNKFSLSFPITKSLLDRNVLVQINKNNLIVENDWLGSIPVFFNPKLVSISTIMTHLIKPNEIIIDEEGLYNYLDFGYSVFEKTPIRNIEFMRYFSKLVITKNKINLKNKKEPVLEYLNKKSVPEEAFEGIRTYINSVEEKIDGKIVIPTSGGFDSRLLNSLVVDKSRIRSFTYGVSPNQSESSEVVKAREFSKILKTEWQSIRLGEFNRYYKEWFKLFGCSTHLHGMYHIEFYKKIKKILPSGQYNLLSGIINDAWSGNVEIKEIKSEKDINELGYSHSLRIDPKLSLLSSDGKAVKKYFSSNRAKLKNERYKVIASMRIKLILLSYLMSLPDYFGIPSWTPFLNIKVVAKILNLNKTERQGRKWLIAYFRENKLYVEDRNLKSSSNNTLDLNSLKEGFIDNINIDVFEKLFDREVLNQFYNRYNQLIQNKTKGKTSLLNLRSLFQKPEIKWYTNITILKSIELALKSNEK